MKINVLCLGDSLKRYERNSELTVGVNDVNKHFKEDPVDFLVVVDPPSAFTFKRCATIINYRCRQLFSQVGAWSVHPDFTQIKFANGRSVLKKLDDKELVCYSNNSAFVACVIAFKMGAKEIDVFGADFNDHPSFTGSSLERCLNDFKNLNAELKKRKVKLRVTKESRLAEFIESF